MIICSILMVFSCLSWTPFHMWLISVLLLIISYPLGKLKYLLINYFRTFWLRLMVLTTWSNFRTSTNLKNHRIWKLSYNVMIDFRFWGSKEFLPHKTQKTHLSKWWLIILYYLPIFEGICLFIIQWGWIAIIQLDPMIEMVSRQKPQNLGTSNQIIPMA